MTASLTLCAAVLLTGECSGQWQAFSIHQRTYRSVLEACDAKHASRVRRAVWHVWVAALKRRRLARHKHVAALRSWAVRLCRRVWRAWLVYRDQRRAAKRAQAEAWEARKLKLFRDGMQRVCEGDRKVQGSVLQTRCRVASFFCPLVCACVCH